MSQITNDRQTEISREFERWWKLCRLVEKSKFESFLLVDFVRTWVSPLRSQIDRARGRQWQNHPGDSSRPAHCRCLRLLAQRRALRHGAVWGGADYVQVVIMSSLSIKIVNTLFNLFCSRLFQICLRRILCFNWLDNLTCINAVTFVRM